MATVNAIALSIIQEFEESTDDSGFVAKVEARINEALDEIAIATDWNTFRTRATFNTSDGEDQYTLPAGGREIIQLRYTSDGLPIAHWTIQQAARAGAQLEDEGKPRFWLEDGTTVSGSNVLYRFRLAPTPDAAYTVEYEYYYHPSDVASGSVLTVQDQHIVLVKDRVRAHLLELDQKYDAADRAQRRFETNLDKLVRREGRKTAAVTILKQTDLGAVRRRDRALLDTAHYNNGLW
jgi:hypothetical protein